MLFAAIVGKVAAFVAGVVIGAVILFFVGRNNKSHVKKTEKFVDKVEKAGKELVK